MWKRVLSPIGKIDQERFVKAASHKQSAISFLQLASSGKARQAFDTYASGDRIAELGDIGQPVPSESGNANGMF